MIFIDGIMLDVFSGVFDMLGGILGDFLVWLNGIVLIVGWID